MSLPKVHKPQTVGELKKVLSELPDDMPLFLCRFGRWGEQSRFTVAAVSKAKPKKVVYRGGVPALFVE